MPNSILVVPLKREPAVGLYKEATEHYRKDLVMKTLVSIATLLVSAVSITSEVEAQVVTVYRPTVTYYAPATTAYYAPGVTAYATPTTVYSTPLWAP